MTNLDSILFEQEERTVTLRMEQCVRIMAALGHAEIADPERFPADRTRQIVAALGLGLRGNAND